MTQQYTPVTWQDETTSQQGTLINAERLNQMQTAHHYADGFEEVDAVPTADPGVSYHKIVYCTADSTIYRWDGTQWTKDIDDETKALLQQEIARATQAESELRGQLEDEHDARVDAEAAINDRITDETTELAQRIATEASTRYTADTALGTRITNETSARETADTGLGNRITAEATARADADTLLGGRIDTEQARAEAAEQANAQAIANTYTKAEIDTALGAKADVATTYTKSEVQTYVSNALDGYLPMVRTTGNQEIAGVKTFTSSPIIKNGTALLEMVDTDDDGTTAPASLQFTGIRHWDKNNADQGGLFFTHTTAGNKEAYLQTLKAGGGYAQLKIISASNGDNYATAPARTYDSSHTDDVVTIGTLKVSTDVVHTSGDEAIYGIKTLRGQTLVLQQAVSDEVKSISFKKYNGSVNAYIECNQYGSIDVHLGNSAALRAPNQRTYQAANTTDVATIGTLDAYTPMVRTTGNQTALGLKLIPETVVGTKMINRVATTHALEVLNIANPSGGLTYLFSLIVSGRFDLELMRVAVAINSDASAVTSVTTTAQGIYALNNTRQIVAGARISNGKLKVSLRAKSGNTSISAMPMNCNVDGLTQTMDLSEYGSVTALSNMTGYVEEA